MYTESNRISINPLINGAKQHVLIVNLLICLFFQFSTIAHSSIPVNFKRIVGEENISSNYANDIIRHTGNIFEIYGYFI